MKDFVKKDKEIDFVATKQNEKIYVQVTQEIKSEKTQKREYEQLLEIKEWSENQKAKLFKIALENNQVTYILKDGDVKKFYSEICKDDNSEEAKNIKDIINKEK